MSRYLGLVPNSSTQGQSTWKELFSLFRSWKFPYRVVHSTSGHCLYAHTQDLRDTAWAERLIPLPTSGKWLTGEGRGEHISVVRFCSRIFHEIEYIQVPGNCETPGQSMSFVKVCRCSLAFLVLARHFGISLYLLLLPACSQSAGEVLCMLELVALNINPGHYLYHLCNPGKHLLLFQSQIFHFNYTFIFLDPGSHLSQTGYVAVGDPGL